MIGDKSIIKEGVSIGIKNTIFDNSTINTDMEHSENKHNEIKMIFLDQDNTLIDTSSAAKKTYKRVFKEIAKDYNKDFETIYSQWKDIVAGVIESSDPKKRSFRFSLEKLLAKLDIADQLKAYYQFYLDTLKDNLKLKKDVTKVLENLNTKYRLVLFTEDQADQNKMKLLKFQLGKYFDLIVNSSDTKKMKPDISYFETAWKVFDIYPNECVYIGDNWKKDCQIGQELGGVGIVFGNDDQRADYNIEELSEVLKILNAD
jgi:putative hydrolase of the HAD superfamily